MLRVVVRNGFSHDMADMLLEDLRRTIEFLEKHPLPPSISAVVASHQSFHH